MVMQAPTMGRRGKAFFCFGDGAEVLQLYGQRRFFHVKCERSGTVVLFRARGFFVFEDTRGSFLVFVPFGFLPRGCSSRSFSGLP